MTFTATSKSCLKMFYHQAADLRTYRWQIYFANRMSCFAVLQNIALDILKIFLLFKFVSDKNICGGLTAPLWFRKLKDSSLQNLNCNMNANLFSKLVPLNTHFPRHKSCVYSK